MLVLPGLASACVSFGPSTKLAASAPIFSPQAFFTGRTVGEGNLRVMFSHIHAVRITGNGKVQPDGALVLSQQVAEAGKPVRERTWRLRALGERFAVTLSDAIGPVDADVVGNRLHLRFKSKDGLRIEQWIYLQRDGQTVLNHMVVRKLGVPVAALRETIRRVP